MEPISARPDTEAQDRILWVEGHRDNRELLAVFLGMAGYTVTSCDSISQAAKVARDRRFDLYIVGDCLPHGSNLPLAARIKAINPHAPLILYSALAFANDIERGLETGAQVYITKPGNLDYLLTTINSLLTKIGPRPADPGGSPGRESCQRGSEQSLRGIQPASEGLAESDISNRAARRLGRAARPRPAIQPWARGRGLGRI